MRIDINADLGEGFGPWAMGDDTGMMSIVTSANIACGGHASDPETMFAALTQARDNGVSVGAHPGFNDREGFGRRVIPMSPDEIGRMCAAQIGALTAMAALVGTPVNYVKPHGALGNLAARDRDVADAIVKAVGGPVFSEMFADRGYLSSGQLVPRGQDGAMIHDAEQAAQRLISFLDTGLMPVVDGDPIPLKAQSICVHGDSIGAVHMAKEIRERLTAHGVEISSFCKA